MMRAFNPVEDAEWIYRRARLASERFVDLVMLHAGSMVLRAYFSSWVETRSAR